MMFDSSPQKNVLKRTAEKTLEALRLETEVIQYKSDSSGSKEAL